MSPSSRRAWIEISSRHSAEGRAAVALLAEGVDRNVCTDITSNPFQVALLAEGVDRNSINALPMRAYAVALLAEGVDRNKTGIVC